MKVALASDLHVEFGDIDLVNEQGADLLILAGDICMLKDLDKQSERGNRARNFFLRVSQAWLTRRKKFLAVLPRSLCLSRSLSIQISPARIKRSAPCVFTRSMSPNSTCRSDANATFILFLFFQGF